MDSRLGESSCFYDFICGHKLDNGGRTEEDPSSTEPAMSSGKASPKKDRLG